MSVCGALDQGLIFFGFLCLGLVVFLDFGLSLFGLSLCSCRSIGVAPVRGGTYLPTGASCGAFWGLCWRFLVAMSVYWRRPCAGRHLLFFVLAKEK